MAQVSFCPSLHHPQSRAHVDKSTLNRAATAAVALIQGLPAPVRCPETKEDEDAFKPLFTTLQRLATTTFQAKFVPFWLGWLLDYLKGRAHRQRLFGARQLTWLADHHCYSVHNNKLVTTLLACLALPRSADC